MLKVENFYNKNQFLIREGEKLILQSYNSIVAIWDNEKQTLVLGKDWDYSRTTTKHIYLFIYDFVRNSKIKEVNEKTNKRDFINKLIKENIIKYDKKLSIK